MNESYLRFERLFLFDFYFRVLELLGIIVTMGSVTSYLKIGPMFIPGYFCMELGSQYHVLLPLLVMALFGGMFGAMTSI